MTEGLADEIKCGWCGVYRREGAPTRCALLDSDSHEWVVPVGAVTEAIERAAKIEAAAWGVIRSANHDDETHIGCGCLSWAAAMSALAGALDD
jgi:hypothetical protein